MDFKNFPINNTVLAKANLNLIYFPPAKAGGNSAGGNSAGGNSGGNSTGEFKS